VGQQASQLLGHLLMRSSTSIDVNPTIAIALHTLCEWIRHVNPYRDLYV